MYFTCSTASDGQNTVVARRDTTVARVTTEGHITPKSNIPYFKFDTRFRYHLCVTVTVMRRIDVDRRHRIAVAHRNDEHDSGGYTVVVGLEDADEAVSLSPERARQLSTRLAEAAGVALERDREMYLED